MLRRKSYLQKKPKDVYGLKPKRIQRVKKRRKKGEIAKLKEQLEALQKQVVIKLYGTLCYTHMPSPADTKTKQLGHMPWARVELSQTCIYDYRFTRIQCGQCNGFGQGMSMTAKRRMEEEGIDLEEMWALNLATKGKVHPKQFYVDKIQEYSLLLESGGNPTASI